MFFIRIILQDKHLTDLAIQKPYGIQLREFCWDSATDDFVEAGLTDLDDPTGL